MKILNKFLKFILVLISINFYLSQKYTITKQWIDETIMNDNKVDGIIYIKKGKDFYVDSLFLETKELNLNRMSGIKDSEKLEQVISLMKKLNGGTIIISRNIIIDRPVIIRDIRGLEIKGITSRYSLQGGQFTSSCIEFTNNGSLTFVDFIDLKIKRINLLNKTTNHSNLLKIYKGYNFEISDINIRSTNSNHFTGIYLGNDSGEDAAFMGSIKHINIISDGGTGIYTGDSNTTLNFSNCYFIGCSWNIKGTVYSVWSSCAVDVSPDNGYNISGGKNSKAHSLTFISCGAEKAQKSAWYFDSGVYGIELITPHSGLNNEGNIKNIGELITLNNSGNQELSNIKISSPIVVKNSSAWDIFITNDNTGTIILDNIYEKAFNKKIGYNNWNIEKKLIIK